MDLILVAAPEAQSGVPMAAIAAWSGHRDAAFTVRRCAHSQPAELADAAAVLGGYLSSGVIEVK